MSQSRGLSAEARRLAEDEHRSHNWKRWGPYLAERQWGTVREDYSPDGSIWADLPHEHARSRAYRWGEDGLLGITDRECRLCFSVALVKFRLFLRSMDTTSRVADLLGVSTKSGRLRRTVSRVSCQPGGYGASA